MDQGWQTFSYVLVPHARDWRHAEAAELTQPAVGVLTTVHAGPLPQRKGYASAEPANLHLAALKGAEDATSYVVRVLETHGVTTQGHLQLPDREAPHAVTFRPHELKTFLVPFDPHEPVRETDLLELA